MLGQRIWRSVEWIDEARQVAELVALLSKPSIRLVQTDLALAAPKILEVPWSDPLKLDAMAGDGTRKVADVQSKRESSRCIVQADVPAGRQDNVCRVVDSDARNVKR